MSALTEQPSSSLPGDLIDFVGGPYDGTQHIWNGENLFAFGSNAYTYAVGPDVDGQPGPVVATFVS